MLHVIDESLAILGAAPAMRITLAYSEQDDTLQLTVTAPQGISPEVFEREENGIAMTILRNFSRDISTDGNTLRVTIK